MKGDTGYGRNGQLFDHLPENEEIMVDKLGQIVGEIQMELFFG